MYAKSAEGEKMEKEKEWRSHRCPVCGKTFIPAGQHMYRINNQLVCTYKCRTKWEKEHPKKEPNRMRKWGG